MPVVLMLVMLLSVTSVQAQTLRMSELDPDTNRAVAPVIRAANALFPRLPGVTLTTRIDALCGGDDETSEHVRYCTDQNLIFLTRGLVAEVGSKDAAFILAHAYGHAVQVRHGVADIALRAITTQRLREVELRRMVESQVACIAGVILDRAFGDDAPDGPGSQYFANAHWGRAPLASRAKIALDLEEQRRWYQIGRRQGLSACEVGDIPIEPLRQFIRR